MGSFDELLNKAVDVANIAGKKTGDVVETSKLKFHEVTLNNDLQRAFQKLGNIVYEAQKTGSDCTELIEQCVAQIDKLNNRIEDIDGKISEIKQQKKCPNCGATSDLKCQFCQRCGTRFD